MMNLRFSRAVALATVIGGLAPVVDAATISIVNQDSVGEGLNDPTPVAPVFGNAGTTLGQQRLNVLQAAANYWGALLQSSVTIRVDAQFNPLSCTPTSALLGSAGPLEEFRDFTGAPRAGTWYVSALANARQGIDLDSTTSDIRARFNSTLDNASPSCLAGRTWFYAVGQTAPSNRVGFFAVAQHELAHGLGFLDLVDNSTGQRLLGFNDAFMLNLEDHSLGKRWDQLSDTQRQASAIDSGDLHWIGTHVEAASGVLSAGRVGNHVRMYAPDPLEPGSSVSHWDTVVSPDEIMEPIATASPVNELDTQAFQDIGWNVLSTPTTCTPSSTVLCLDNNPGDRRFMVTTTFQTATQSTTAGNAISLASVGVTKGGLFWFFDPTNPELLVKVINGCSLNNRFWVFMSAGTNVAVTVTIVDTTNGHTYTKTNPLNTAFPTLQDTAVGLACP